jgi:hypothetical protein
MGIERCFVVTISCPISFWYFAHMDGPLVMQSSYVSSIYLCVFLFLIRILVFLNLAFKMLCKRMLVCACARARACVRACVCCL